MRSQEQTNGACRELRRDTRAIIPYTLRAHQLKERPLTCLWWELRYHGFGPLADIEPRVLHVMRGRYDLDFYGMRALFPELGNIPPPTITTCARCDCGHCAVSK